MKFQWAIVTMIGVLLLTACSGLRSPDDKAITTDIQAKLFSDPILKTRDVHVDAKNGIVTLSGSVGTDLEKTAIERMASQEDGVKSVVDMLSVTPAASGPEVAESTPLQPVAPAAPPPEPSTPKKARQKHSPPAASAEAKSAADLRAYTSSLAQEPASNPAPAPAAAEPGPAPGAPAPAAPAPPAPASPPLAPTPPPAPKPLPPPQVSIPAGTVVTIRMVDSIDSSRNSAGEEFAATVDAPVVVDGHTLAARGADARVRLALAKSAGTMTGQSELRLELVALTLNGVPYTTKSGYYEQHGASRGTRTAETVGGGAIVGALIGGILGHGKGAAIGTLAGAGAGAAVQASMKGQHVKVPSETKIDFTLGEPVNVDMGGGQ